MSPEREALQSLVSWIKTNKRTVLHGLTARETRDLLDELHKANIVLSNKPVIIGD